MTYTQLAVTGVVVVVLVDLVVLRTRLLTRKAFWTAYAIIVFFQLVTNGVLTGFGIVRYDGEAIIGSSTPLPGPPPFLGDGRIAFAPVEDLLFGFAMVVLTLVLWVWWGRRGVQRTPYAGPLPRWWPVGGAFGASRAPEAANDDGGDRSS
jgi:lycopene cyclase domain-containing protein